jgi:hypothetical protein
MIKIILFKLGFISIKDVECEIDKLSKLIDNTAPPTKFKDGTKNIRFFAERDLMNKFIKDLYILKINLKYYYPKQK